jgi:hypothetical protein
LFLLLLEVSRQRDEIHSWNPPTLETFLASSVLRCTGRSNDRDDLLDFRFQSSMRAGVGGWGWVRYLGPFGPADNAAATAATAATVVFIQLSARTRSEGVSPMIDPPRVLSEWKDWIWGLLGQGGQLCAAKQAISTTALGALALRLAAEEHSPRRAGRPTP